MWLGAIGLIIYIALFSQATRTYGWAAVLLLMLGIPFMAAALWCFVFPNVAVLAPPLAVSGIALLIGGVIYAWNYPPARARRIQRRQRHRAELRWAQEVIAQNQRMRGR